jgi:hypothetical protein
LIKKSLHFLQKRRSAALESLVAAQFDVEIFGQINPQEFEDVLIEDVLSPKT